MDKNNKTNSFIDSTLISYISDNQKAKNKLNFLFKLTLVLFILIILWSMFTSMEQTMPISGHITPQSGIAKIRHEDGGEVTKIYVKNYDKVKVGDLLVTLNDKKILTSLKQHKSKLKVVDSEIIHSAAFLKNNIDAIKNDNIIDKTELKQVENYLNNISDTIGHSAQLIEASKLSSDKKDEVILAQINKNKIEIKRLGEEIIVLEEQLNYLNEQRQIFNKLLESKNVSKIRALDFEIKYREILRELKKAKSDKNFKTKETVELESKRIVQRQDSIKEKYEELIKLNKEKIDLISNINQLETSLEKLDIKSPIDGIIQGVEIVKGVTVQPGEELLAIVPSSSEIVFEGQATMKQKGKINELSKAQVQFDGFNILTYDRIDATIINISPYTFEDNDSDKQNDFFKVVAKLNSNDITSSNSSYKIKPGMSGTLYVTTEEQSIFAYLFGPIYNAFANISNQ